MIEENRWNIQNIIPFSKHLDTLEKKIILIPNVFNYENEISFGKVLENKILSVVDAKTDHELIITVLKVLSLQYRIKKSCGGITPLNREEEHQYLIDLLSRSVKEWKEGIEYYIDKELKTSDLKKIKELCRYERFIPILLRNEKIMDEFFKLVFRDNFPINILIQYYKTCSIDLKNALLSIRVGFFNTYSNQKMVKIEKNILNDGSKEKDLQFFINRKFVSILDDEEKIELNGGIYKSWKEIKKIWEIGKKLPAEMEVFEDQGMLMFRPQALKYQVNGSIVAVNTTKPKFWEGEDVPTFLTLSKEKLENMLNITITKEKPCVATIEASCLDPFQVKDAHGASTIYLPNKDGTTYRAFPFGKYAKNFPQTDMENACFIGNSVEAELTYPDPTPFYSQRIHGVSPHLLTLEQTEALLSKYGKDIWLFQFASNNCSADFQLIFEEMFGKLEEGGMTPDYFRQPLLESKFFFPADYVFESIAGLHPSIASILVHGIHVLCGSKREYSRTEENGSTKTVSLYNSEYSKTHNLYVPGQLVYRILTGKIEGVTWFGYD